MCFTTHTLSSHSLRCFRFLIIQRFPARYIFSCFPSSPSRRPSPPPPPRPRPPHFPSTSTVTCLSLLRQHVHFSYSLIGISHSLFGNRIYEARRQTRQATPSPRQKRSRPQTSLAPQPHQPSATSRPSTQALSLRQPQTPYLHSLTLLPFPPVGNSTFRTLKSDISLFTLLAFDIFFVSIILPPFSPLFSRTSPDLIARLFSHSVNNQQPLSAAAFSRTIRSDNNFLGQYQRSHLP